MTDLGSSELHIPGRDFISQIFPFLPEAGYEGLAVALLVPLQYRGQRGERDIPKLTVNRPPFPEASCRVYTLWMCVLESSPQTDSPSSCCKTGLVVVQ